MSFKRKLSALDYPNPEKFDANNQPLYRGVVVWLEDQKIRHYTIDDRVKLRDVESESWPTIFHKYLLDLACPIMSGTPAEILDWLLGCAVRFEYGEKLELYNKQTRENVKHSRVEQPKVVSNNPLDNLDFSTPEFRAGVEALADSLQISKHPDHLVTLQAICKLVAARLNPKALSNPSAVIPQGEPYPYKESELGFDTGDPLVNDAAKILRLLHIQDMRTLQTKINECIVAIQAVTANPKTDTRLGKVGR